jgi:hypothetical protein
MEARDISLPVDHLFMSQTVCGEKDKGLNISVVA